MLKEFFAGFIKLHIVYHAAQAPVFGLDLIRELARHGYDLSPGTLYPTLHKLEQTGFLRCEDKVVNGKIRKYYVATPLGKKALKEARAKITELVSEIIDE
ncbi:MAG: helix-turn-helix transcriptional regulator [Chloroflexi bacterium]|nr:helix-turn-helix transcriptional regulator [Chloroflexota bacterium]